MPLTLDSTVSRRASASSPSGASAQAPQQRDLGVVHGVDVGVAQADRPLQPGLVVEQVGLAGDALDGLLRPLVLRLQAGEHLLAVRPGRPGTSRRSAMSRSALRSDACALSTQGAEERPVAIGGGQLVPACRSSPAQATSALPRPYHAGRFTRLCVQAKTQGMARRSSMPVPGRRRAGRLPRLRNAISSIGVAAWK